MDKIRNEYISGTSQIEQFEDNVREAKLKWFGYAQRRES